MSVAFLQAGSNEALDSGTSQDFTWGSATTAGSARVVAVFWKLNVTVTSVVDTDGNTYTDCGSGRLSRPTDGFLQLFYCLNCVGSGTGTITVTWSSSADERSTLAAEYSGVATSSAASNSTTGTGTSGTTISATAITPTPPSGAIIAFANTNGSGSESAGSGFTKRAGSDEGIILEDQIFISSLGLTTPSATGGSFSKGAIIAFVLSASASVATANTGSLLKTPSVLTPRTTMGSG